MKNKCFLFGACFLLAVGAAQAQTQNHTLAITEVGESPLPVVTYDGSPITLDPSSTLLKDNWTVVLPTGFFLLQGLPQVPVGEPENPAQVNIITIGTQPNTLLWESDVQLPAGAGGFQNPVTVPNAGVFVGANGGQEVFNLVLADEPGRSAPDGGSTALLLGLGVIGLASARRLRKA